jgi:hypothetical protein
MIGRMDEYLIHQTVATLDRVASDDMNWQDRFYFNIHDREGKFVAITGLGAFPNRRTVEAYLFAVCDGHHYSYLANRSLGNDREDMSAGGLCFSVVEPLSVWRLQLQDPDNAIEADLEFRAGFQPYEFKPIFWEKGGRVVAHQAHYTQGGAYSGSFRVGDREITDLIGLRDRSWGIRSLLDVDMWYWVSAQFPDYFITAWLWETRDGKPISMDGALVRAGGEVRPFVAMEHELELWPGAKRPKSASYTLTDIEGKKLALSAGELSTICLALGVPLHFEESDQETWKKAQASSLGFDQFCQFRCGDDVGYGVIEYMMSGGSQRYNIAPFSP